MTLLQIGDQRLDYTEHAGSRDETPLVFIHGILSSQHTWLDFPLRFRQYGRILTLSLPGHYPARFPARMPRSTITDSWVGETLAEALRQITGGKPAILIGHSTGGYASLAIAWRAPQLVQGVISLAGFARGTWTSLLGYLQQLHHLGAPGSWLFDAQVWLSTRNAWMVDLVWRLCSYDTQGFAQNAAYWQMRPQMMQQVRRIEARAMRLWFYQMRTVADLTPHLPSIQVPVLAIAGSQDSIVPASQSTLIAERVANGTGVLLDHMDHALFVEQPERVSRSMMTWLEQQRCQPGGL